LDIDDDEEEEEEERIGRHKAMFSGGERTLATCVLIPSGRASRAV
jgi:hypothetical protein